ncbi:MAG: FecR family protein [Acidobacteriia bacterium]|nr:FecR family protein [Terriglobia bacterium]
MKSRTVWRIAFLLMLVLPLATGQAPAPQQTSLAVGQGTIAAIKGNVSIHSVQGAAVPTQRGQVLAPETVIETEKGSVLLNLQDGSQVQIKGHSRVVLKDPTQGKKFSLELFIGEVLTKIQKKLGSTPSFRMGTPTAVITVRGTQFLTEVDKKGKTSLYVYEGVVEVRGMMIGARPVLVGPGYRTYVPRDRDPERPQRINNLDDNRGPGGRSEREQPDSSRGDSSSRQERDQQQQQQQQQPGRSREPD